jgi:hypothetical protein
MVPSFSKEACGDYFPCFCGQLWEHRYLTLRKEKGIGFCFCTAIGNLRFYLSYCRNRAFIPAVSLLMKGCFYISAIASFEAKGITPLLCVFFPKKDFSFPQGPRPMPSLQLLNWKQWTGERAPHTLSTRILWSMKTVRTPSLIWSPSFAEDGLLPLPAHHPHSPPRKWGLNSQLCTCKCSTTWGHTLNPLCFIFRVEIPLYSWVSLECNSPI